MSSRRRVNASASAGDPLLALVDLRRQGERQRQQERCEIARARDAGHSWRLIGAALGVTAQAVQQRAARVEAGST